MIIKDDKDRAARSEELKRISEPIVDFLYRYGCPHSVIIITQTSAELFNGECGIPFDPRD